MFVKEVFRELICWITNDILKKEKGKFKMRKMLGLKMVQDSKLGWNFFE